MDSTSQAPHSYRAETGHDTERKKKTSRTVTTDRLQAGKNTECPTPEPVGAGITSPLGMKTTTELCRQKRRRIQACSHNRNRAGIVIYIMGVGGGRGQEGVGNPVQRQCCQVQGGHNKEKSWMILISYYVYSEYIICNIYIYIYIYFKK